ncbi:small conductance mechanosensitive channel [Ruminococcus sp. YE71]|uniref:mechanosensitive ion channel family protein n=1 Tax=unclassified Ruminococcus TaxID=2608920 RepID=UPI0008826FA4|nr:MULTISPECIES: mechanosensitive ion channel family protein [unclassified Ruminococcus]SDA19681.1 small conductance mechanosensitive channel [Ruminococcus sp. YE78]SFW31189.1 small conductance mechanosensitive channel [Ruminococcus sp. YE71]
MEFLETLPENKLFLRTAKSLGLIIAVWIGWTIFKSAYERFITKREGLRGATGTFTTAALGIIRVAVMLLTAIAVLQINGVNVTSLVAGLGIVSVIVGLALQDMLKDVIMGIHILSDNFFRVGDVVKYGDIEGTVVDFNLHTTKIRSIDTRDVMVVCNRCIDTVVKRSTMTDIDIGLSYEDDYRRVNEVMKGICARIGGMEGIDRCEYKGTQDFGESAVIYRVRIFCRPEQRPELRRCCLRLIQYELTRAGLRIPYQQIDVHSV